MSPATVRGFAEDLRHASFDALVLGVVDRETGQRVGAVRLDGIDWRSRVARIHLALAEAHYWERGHARESLRLLTAHAFLALGLRKICAIAPAPDAASATILKELGFALEGTLREAGYSDGAYVDWLAFGMFEGELRAPNGIP